MNPNYKTFSKDNRNEIWMDSLSPMSYGGSGIARFSSNIPNFEFGVWRLNGNEKLIKFELSIGTHYHSSEDFSIYYLAQGDSLNRDIIIPFEKRSNGVKWADAFIKSEKRQDCFSILSKILEDIFIRHIGWESIGNLMQNSVEIGKAEARKSIKDKVVSVLEEIGNGSVKSFLY